MYFLTSLVLSVVLDPNSGCFSSVLPYICYIFFMFSMNISILFVVKFGSASFSFVSSALVLPLSNILNTSSLVMSEELAAPVTVGTWVGLPLILAGLVGYAIGE